MECQITTAICSVPVDRKMQIPQNHNERLSSQDQRIRLVIELDAIEGWMNMTTEGCDGNK